jgi:hypothetical protein
MKNDKIALLVHSAAVCTFIAAWIGLSLVSQGPYTQVAVNCLAFGVAALYYRFSLRGKLGAPQAENSEVMAAAERLPIREVLGVRDAFRQVQYACWKRNAKDWPLATAKVRSHSILSIASNLGWLCISYGFTVGDRQFQGEVRKLVFATGVLETRRSPEVIALLKAFP